MNYVKYPRTFHLPSSMGVTSDDKIMKSIEVLEESEVVVTVKFDGENTTMYRDHIHARSTNGGNHESRDWCKMFWANIRYMIPEDYRICGENLYAKHSIEYNYLLSYFYGFSVWDQTRNVALDWDNTKKVFHELGIVPVHEIYRGEFNKDVLKKLIASIDTSTTEGFVVRTVKEIPYNNFNQQVGKWVRKNHVQTDQHWMKQKIVANRLIEHALVV